MSKLKSYDSLSGKAPKAATHPSSSSAFLKVNLQLPSTWLQSCLPPSKSQLHRCGAVLVKAVIFHTQTHVAMHLHRCPVHAHTHTHRHKHLQRQLFLAAVEGAYNVFLTCLWWNILMRTHGTIIYSSSASWGKLVSAWKTVVYLPWGFILGCMWDDYKPVFIIWKMERPC